MTTPTVDIEHRVAQYVTLRDEIKRRDDEHKAKMLPLRELLEKMNNVLLAHLNTVNGEGVKTSSGTVYRREKPSASLADPDAFMRYVIENEEWDLIDRKANITAVSDYIAEHGAPPAGVNYSVTYLVGVRRS